MRWKGFGVTRRPTRRAYCGRLGGIVQSLHVKSGRWIGILCQKGRASTHNILDGSILWLTKCSVAFLFIRLTPDSKHVTASYVVLGLSTILMLISELLVAIRCDEPQPWIIIGVKCGDLVSCSAEPHGTNTDFSSVHPMASDHSIRRGY